MLIRELAKRTGVSPYTIRYYESVGLLPAPQRGDNQYRLYTEAEADRLRFILGARSLHFSLSEIARLLAARDTGALPCQQVLTSLAVRQQEIEQRIADLQLVRAALERLQQEAQARPQPLLCDDQCVCHLLTIVPFSRKRDRPRITMQAQPPRTQETSV
jgi:DNA-binding transcriptional MerR regulator